MPFFNRFGSANTKNFGLSKVSDFKFTATISASVQNYNVRTAALAGGWDGLSRLIATITVNAGVYVWTDTTSTAAFVTGSMPAGSTVNIVNNGFIMGKGGNAGSNGGPAIDLSANANITNNSYIAGGGGGGWGAAGGLAFTGTVVYETIVNAGPGGSANAPGSNAYIQAADGSAGTRGTGGKAINLNGYSVTYIIPGPIFGAVS